MIRILSKVLKFYTGLLIKPSVLIEQNQRRNLLNHFTIPDDLKNLQSIIFFSWLSGVGSALLAILVDLVFLGTK
jgi:hypothetical protein